MRILFLDDDASRHKAFGRMASASVVDHVWSVAELRLSLLDNEAYDCVFLDHDLGDFGNSDDESGLDAASFIALHLAFEKRPKSIVIHSWNPEGALRMENVLKDAGITAKRIPFSFIG